MLKVFIFYRGASIPTNFLDIILLSKTIKNQILKRDTNKKEVNSSTPANNRLRKTKVNAASNVKKSSNPLLDDDEDLITDSLQLKGIEPYTNSISHFGN